MPKTNKFVFKSNFFLISFPIYIIIIDIKKIVKEFQMKIEDLIKELEKIQKKHGNIEVQVQYRDDGGDYYGTDDEVRLQVENDIVDLDDDGEVKEGKVLIL